MTSDLSILFIPNYGLNRLDDQYALATSEVDTINTLTEAGFHVTVLAFCVHAAADLPRKALRESDRLIIRSVSVESKAGLPKKLANYARYVGNLLYTLSGDCKLIYIYYPGTVAEITSLLAAVFRKPFGLYVRGDWKYRIDFRLFSSFILKRANFVIATGAGFAAEIKEFCNAVEPVVPMLMFDGSKSVARTYEIDGSFDVLFVGRILKEKGVLDTVRAIAELRRTGCDATLTIVGGGTDEDKKALIDQIASSGLIGVANYLGHLTDSSSLDKLYNSSDVFVFPSYYAEGFPRVVYEAMLNAMPIICTVLPGMRGFMEDDHNCISVPDRDVVALRDSLIRIYADPSLRSRLGRQAQDDVQCYLRQFRASSHGEQIVTAVKQHYPNLQ